MYWNDRSYLFGLNMTMSEKIPQQVLPVWSLMAFTVAGFLSIMTETIPAGLLPLIGYDLQISEAWVGQFISIYALGSVIAAIPVVYITRGYSRKGLFLYAIAGLFIFNTLTAILSNYYWLLVVRFIAGMAAGVIWGILAGYARSMVSIDLQGRAMAIVGIGQPIALCMGVPLGTWLGDLLGWRGVFAMISILALVLMVWVKISLPNVAGQMKKQQRSILTVFLQPGIWPILAVIFLWIFAHNMLYTFLSPYLASVKLDQHLDLVLLLFGFSALIGIGITGIWVDRALRILTLSSLTGFACAAISLGLLNQYTWIVLLGIILWGITFGGAPTLLQTALADVAGDYVDIAQSMLVTVFNLAVAAGAILGGVMLNRFGINSIFIVMVILACSGLWIVFRAKKYSFKQGQRLAHSST